MAILLIPGAMDPMKSVFIFSGKAPPTTNALAGIAPAGPAALGGPPALSAVAEGGGGGLTNPGGAPTAPAGGNDPDPYAGLGMR
jgi:hypothetical protein